MFAIGENIAALRKSRGITQEQLGHLVGVSARRSASGKKAACLTRNFYPPLPRPWV